MQYLLADSEMKALLAGSPQAVRLLRPLCRMLGVELGPEFSPPRRESRPRRRVRAAPANGAGGGDAADAGAGVLDAFLGSGPASSLGAGGEPGSPFASTGSHSALQNGNPAWAYRPGPAPFPGLGEPIRKHDHAADAGAYPPLSVPWRDKPG